MSKIKRYATVWEDRMRESSEGGWVRFEDAERLRALLVEVQNDAGNWLSSDLQKRIAQEVGPGGTSPSGYDV